MDVSVPLGHDATEYPLVLLKQASSLAWFGAARDISQKLQALSEKQSAVD
jgi:hypothetical protein